MTTVTTTTKTNKWDTTDLCPACDTVALLSAAPIGAITFHDAVCFKCRKAAVKDAAMDDFDRAYERARANGWAD